jgi:hypothetical protein
MGQRLIISESEKNRIKGLYENNMDMKDGGLSKRPFDGMITDCLKSEGFVTDDTNGKYELSMSKRKMEQNGKVKVDYIIRSTEDPASFTTYELFNGKLNRNGFFKIGTSTNCKTIVDSAHLLINVQQNNQIPNFER